MQGLTPRLMIGALFIIGHDAAHNSFTPYSWLNRLLGRLVLLPAWHPYTSWAYAHNTLHHGGTNLRGKHPDFTPLTKEEYDRLPRWRRLLEKFYLPLAVWPRVQLSHRLLLWLHSLPEARAPPAAPSAVRVRSAAGVRVLRPANPWDVSLGSPDIGTVFTAARLCVRRCDPALDGLDPVHGIYLVHSAYPSSTGLVRQSEGVVLLPRAAQKLDACGFSVPHRKAPKQHHGPRRSSYRPRDSALSSAQKPALARAKLRGTCGGHPLVSLAILGIVPRL